MSIPRGYTEEELREEAAHYWGTTPLQSFEDFRTLASRLANEIVSNLAAEQYEAAKALMFVAAQGRNYAFSDVMLAEQEQWELKNLMGVAGSAVVLGEFADAISSSRLVLQILAERIERQRSQGQVLRPCTEARLAAYGTLGACIWEQRMTEEELPIHPHRLAEGYEAIHRRAMWFIRKKLSRDSRGKHQAYLYVEQLGYYGLNICKALARYSPQSLPSVIAKYNEAQGPTLAAEPWHFKLHRPLRPDSWLYWDFEIAKIWIAGQLNLQDFAYMRGERLRALRQAHPERPVDAFLALWERQQRTAPLLRESSRNRPESSALHV